MNQELHELIQRAKRGKEDAFSQLVTLYKGEVFRHAYAMVNDKMEAEDIAQEAFLKAYLSLPKLENEYAFVSWLTRIVTNLCYDRLKKMNKTKSYSSEEDMISIENDEMEHIQTRLTIQEAMQRLSVEHRTVIILKDVQGYSYDEIATILHIPVGTVKSRLNAARMMVRKEISRGDENA
ncbi:RNA polymerase sigma factor [Ectobacillus sp. sgz5001026]|uniref:RNA polymerase sigma factor n=1 Tax=Ectobacillus sp. sgz5001026 TaxID=3242473 RepID=UPI0036D39A32